MERPVTVEAVGRVNDQASCLVFGSLAAHCSSIGSGFFTITSVHLTARAAVSHHEPKSAPVKKAAQRTTSARVSVRLFQPYFAMSQERAFEDCFGLRAGFFR